MWDSCVSDLRLFLVANRRSAVWLMLGFESSCGRNVAKIFDTIPKMEKVGLGLFLTQMLDWFL